MENKIAILTFHRANNYGAVLQCYALCETIKKLGGVPEVIDYWPEVFRKAYLYDYPFAFSKEYVKAMIKKGMTGRVIKSRNSEFETFVKTYLPLSSRTYYTAEQVEGEELCYSIYVCGSDQVWNYTLTNSDRIFFLNFPSAQNKYSYAASFGLSSLPEGMMPKYRRFLQGYKAYSVREDEGRKLISELEGAEACVHCDPALLLEAEEWKKIEAVASEDKPYILLYCVSATEKIMDAAEKLSKLTGYKVVYMTSSTNWRVLSGIRKTNMEFKPTASPGEFLSYMRRATYVLTNSFHGTVFACLYKKNFLVESKDKAVNANGRITNLLSLLGLSSKELDGTEVERISDKVDWENVESLLLSIRTGSLSYLREIVNESNAR